MTFNGFNVDERDTITSPAPIHSNDITTCEFGSDAWKNMMKEIARSQLLPPIELLQDVWDVHGRIVIEFGEEHKPMVPSTTIDTDSEND